MMSVSRPRRLPALIAWGGFCLSLSLLAVLPVGCYDDPGSRPAQSGVSPLDPALFGTDLPQGTVVRFVARWAPSLPEEAGLLIESAGETIVSAEGRASRRVVLPADSLATITGWFTTAGFTALQNSYLANPPQTPVFEVVLVQNGVEKRVQAQASLLPAALQTLVGRLEALTAQLLDQSPSPPSAAAIRGALTVTPVSADTAVARTLQLSLANTGADSVTLNFTTVQLYDFVLSGGPPGAGGYPGFGVRGRFRGRSGRLGLAQGDTPGSPDLSGGAVIWNWAHGQVFAANPTRLVFAPHEVKTYQETWNGRDNSGAVVAPGTYRLAGQIPADQAVPVIPAVLVVQGTTMGPARLSGVLQCDPVQGPSGTARNLTLSVTNPGAASVKVVFPTSQQFDFGVASGGGGGRGPDRFGDHRGGGLPPALIWKWSTGQTFTQTPDTLTWAAGETRTFTATWNGDSASGTAAAAGNYELSGVVTGKPETRAVPIRFLVTAP